VLFAVAELLVDYVLVDDHFLLLLNQKVLLIKKNVVTVSMGARRIFSGVGSKGV